MENTVKEQIVDEKSTSTPDIHWEPVSNLSKERDPYEYAPESVREYHRNYVKLWLSKKGRE